MKNNKMMKLVINVLLILLVIPESVFLIKCSVNPLLTLVLGFGKDIVFYTSLLGLMIFFILLIFTIIAIFNVDIIVDKINKKFKPI